MNLLLLVSIASAAPFYSSGGKVELPWNDFNALFQKYAQDQDPKPTPPRDWTLDRAVFAGTIVGTGDDAYALVKLQLRGAVHKKDGWAAVPLLGASTALRSAKVGGKDAPLYVQNGFYTLLADKPGVFEAELEFAVKLFEADGETGFTLPLPSAGATVVGLSVPSAEPLEFEVPGAQGQNVTSLGTERRLEAYVPSMASLTVSWHRDISESKEQKREARVYAETRTLVGVSEGVLACRADIDYTVLHAEVDHFKVKMPAQATVLDVRGNGIRTWTQESDGTIDVALNYGAEGLYRLGIDYERTNAGGDVPLVRLSDVTRETDYVGVDARSAVEIVSKGATGAVPIDVRELPAALTGQTDFPVLLAYRARGGDVKIPIEVKQHPDMDMLVTLVDTASAETLVTEDGRRMTRVRYGVRNNRKQFLRMSLPKGAEVWSASVAGRGVKVSAGDGGAVLIPLVRSDASGGALTAFLVELVYVEAGGPLADGKGELKVELPTVDAPSSVLQWTVYIPPTATIVPKTTEGTVRRVDYFSAAPVLPAEAVVSQAAQNAVRGEVANQGETGALGQGVEPVEVQLPLAGNAYYFEKTLVLQEGLWVGFDYKHKVKAR